MDRYRAQGWEVVDTRVEHPYDARAFRGDMICYLEAKGTTTAGETVTVTPNEVEWARTHVGECVMGIWSGIEFDASRQVLVGPGEFRLFDWNPAPEELDPVHYDWMPNQAKLMS